MNKNKNVENIRAFALIMCAGAGHRTGLMYNKLLHQINGKAVAAYTLDSFAAARQRGVISEIITVCSGDDFPAFTALANEYGTHITKGGSTRLDSVKNGLEFLQREFSPSARDIVLVCDGARPNTSVSLIEECVDSAIKSGSGVAAIPCSDTIKTAEGGVITSSPDRAVLYAAQTPQAFNFAALLSAYRSYTGNAATDDSAVFAAAGNKARLVKGSGGNYKITSAEDIQRFENEKRFLNDMGLCAPDNSRIGIGSDTHTLVLNRPLILGGVTIPHYMGLKGHSDADALIHAVIDALLSAAGMRDIGCHFPDSDPKYKGADSMLLLKETVRLIKDKAAVINISAVIHAEKPKLNPYIPDMIKNIGAALGTGAGRVSISAKTGEGVGIIGEEKAVCCEAACLVKLL